MYLQHSMCCQSRFYDVPYFYFFVIWFIYILRIFNALDQSDISHYLHFLARAWYNENIILSSNIIISPQLRLCLIQGFIAIFLFKNSFFSLRYFPQNSQHLSKGITQDTDLYAALLYRIIFIYQIFILLFLIFTFLFTFHLHSF